MYAKLSENYRLIGRSLYKKQGDTYIHVALIPVGMNDLVSAVQWFEELEDNE